MQCNLHNTSFRTRQWSYISVLPHSRVHKVHSVTSLPLTPRSLRRFSSIVQTQTYTHLIRIRQWSYVHTGFLQAFSI